MADQATYPRPLRPKERDLLDGVLPVDRPGYRQYRNLLDQALVLAQGKRGTGHLMLGRPADQPDTALPLLPVFAYGVVETTRDVITVVVREAFGTQFDAEIMSSAGETIPEYFEEKRRWTYSTWLPGMPSPASGKPLREVPVTLQVILVIAPADRRLWVYDAASGVNHLIPITNFYNELMLHKGIRDPNIALASGKFFGEHGMYSDDDLHSAFEGYNRTRRLVAMQSTPPAYVKPEGFLAALRRKIGRTHHD